MMGKLEMAEIERLMDQARAASRPDRELDRDIHAALDGWEKVWNDKLEFFQLWKDGKWIGLGSVPKYTESVDAALALTERLMPGWFWRAGHIPSVHWENGVGYENWCHISRTTGSHCEWEDEATGWAHSVPLAIIMATLKALSKAKEGKE